MAETYLEEPCFYLGPVLKRKAVDLRADGTRQWHTNMEDDRIVRLLVYSSPVADNCGPFEYLAVDDTMRMRAETGYRTGYRTDG